MRILYAALAILACVAVPQQVSSYAIGTCPSFTEVADKSMKHFQYTKYQGEWYHTATTEPTEPKYCKCDRLTWTLNTTDAGRTFTNILDTQCTFPFPLGPTIPAGTTLPLVFIQTGITTKGLGLPSSQTGSQMEGAVDAGFPLGRQYIVYVDTQKEPSYGYGQTNKYHYQNAIVFSCGLNYTTYPNGPAAPAVIYPYFNSVQFLTRSSNPSQKTLDRLISKAKSLGIRFDVADIDYKLKNQNCTFPPSKLESSVAQIAAASSDDVPILPEEIANSASTTTVSITIIATALAVVSHLL